MTAVPTGVFDSGVGGLSILCSIHQLLPAENLVYVADSAHAPYGPKGAAFVRQRSAAIMQFLLSQNVKAVVVACNTATAAAVAQLREQYELPIIGVEPAVKPAAALSRSGVVGVLATSGTIASDKFMNLQSRFTPELELITRACPGLVEHIEAGIPDTAALRGLLASYIEPLLVRNVDTLVLGCTHYSLIRELIQDVAGNSVTIVDAGSAVAKELQRRLQAESLQAKNLQAGNVQGGNVQGGNVQGGNVQKGTVTFFTSGDPARQAQLISRYWHTPVTVAALPAE